MGFAARFVSLIAGRIKWLILLFWVVLVGLSAWQAPLLITRSTTSFTPPYGSLAAIGNAKFAESFPSRGVSSSFALFVDHAVGTSGSMKSFSDALNASFASNPLVVQFDGYWILKEMGLPSQAYESFVSKSGNSSFFSLTLNLPFSAPEAVSWAEGATQTVADYCVQYLPAGAQCYLLGIPSFIPVMIHDIELNLGTMDAIVLPISFLIFLLLTKSFRLLLLPIIGMLLSLALSFASGTIVSYFTPVMSYLPSLLMSLVISMSFDYALFISVRYREELLLANSDPVKVVTTVLETAGHTILVSGTILCVTFLILAAVPLAFVQVTGIVTAISILWSLIANLTVIPCLFLAFPNFYARSVESFMCCGKRFTYGSRPDGGYQTLQSPEEADVSKMRHSNWYRLGELNTKPLAGILFALACIALVAPLAYFAVTYTQSDSLIQDLPRGADITAGYQNFAKQFGAGFIYPTQLLLMCNESLVQEKYFALVASIIDEIAAETGTPKDRWTSVLYSEIFGPSNWFNTFQQCQNPKNQENPICKGILFGESQLLNATAQATVLVYASADDPLSPGGKIWLAKARQAVSKVLVSSSSNVQGYFFGTPVDSWDTITAVADYFPIMIGATAGVVLVFLAIVFRSFLIPLRSVLSLSMAVLCVFGAAALVFDNGILDWLTFAGLQSSGGLTWLIPVVTFGILIGISLDYEIYLLTRVEEVRWEGYSSRDAIKISQYKTGPVISAAGLIMAVAFAGLILSSTTSLNQMGFILSFSVLVDTFILRAIFVPSVMALFGESSWVPRKPPAIVKSAPKAHRMTCCCCCKREIDENDKILN